MILTEGKRKWFASYVNVKDKKWTFMVLNSPRFNWTKIAID